MAGGVDWRRALTRTRQVDKNKRRALTVAARGGWGRELLVLAMAFGPGGRPLRVWSFAGWSVFPATSSWTAGAPPAEGTAHPPPTARTRRLAAGVHPGFPSWPAPHASPPRQPPCVDRPARAPAMCSAPCAERQYTHAPRVPPCLEPRHAKGPAFAAGKAGRRLVGRGRRGPRTSARQLPRKGLVPAACHRVGTTACALWARAFPQWSGARGLKGCLGCLRC